MRTPIERDGRTREIIGSPNTEAIGHLANLTGQLLRSLAVLRERKEAGQAELETVKQIIFSSMPPERLQVIRELTREGASSAEIARRIRLPRTRVYRVFEELEVLGIVERRDGRFHPTEEARLFYYGTVETPAA